MLKTRGWRGRLSRPLLIISGAITLALVSGYVGYQLSPDPWEKFCAESARDLPDLIPQRLVVDVMGEYHERFTGQTKASIETGLRAALAIYNFSERVLLSFEDLTVTEPGDHIMELRVYLREGIPNEGPRLFGWVPGRMCGNAVFVQMSSDPSVSRLRFLHELGHLFGLYHVDGTYMRTSYLEANPQADCFNLKQLEVLEVWNHPGAPYVEHWFQPRNQDGEC